MIKTEFIVLHQLPLAEAGADVHPHRIQHIHPHASPTTLLPPKTTLLVAGAIYRPKPLAARRLSPRRRPPISSAIPLSPKTTRTPISIGHPSTHLRGGSPLALTPSLSSTDGVGFNAALSRTLFNKIAIPPCPPAHPLILTKQTDVYLENRYTTLISFAA